ncbi:hypothetical protein [Phytoactinopolyspora halotolerans]|nr:hypothetical protein [Phytoactinopolyspora halotolerans]
MAESGYSLIMGLGTRDGRNVATDVPSRARAIADLDAEGRSP